ncbi:hypothetical protein U1Q18_040515 [Sarracenia purpurea var. burkii]
MVIEWLAYYRDISTKEVKHLVFSPEKETFKPLGLGADSKKRVDLGPSLPLIRESSIPLVSADLNNSDVELGSESVLAMKGVASDEFSSSSGGNKDELEQEEAELVDVGDVGSGGFHGPAVKAASLNLGPVSSDVRISEPNLDSKSDIAINFVDDLDPIEGGRGLRVGVKGNLSKSALQVLDKLPKQFSGKNTQVRGDVAVPTDSVHVKSDSWVKIVANGGLQLA